MYSKRSIDYLKTMAYRSRLLAERRQQEKTAGSYCMNCGVEVEQTAGRKRKKFCSDKCRMTWWGKNKKTGFVLWCQQCKKQFTAYPDRKRKYCSHECYVKARFGKKRK